MKLVLKNTSCETDVRLIAMINSWEFVVEFPRVNNSPHQVQWKYGPSTIIVFMEDFLLNMNYLVVDGNDCQVIKKQVIDGLEIYQEADIDRLNTEVVNTPEASLLINAAALMITGSFEQSYYDLILRAMNSTCEEVQRTAIFAVNYTPWIELRDTLLSLKNTYPYLSKDIEIVIEANDTHGWIK
jgi:hypothetical protein